MAKTGATYQSELIALCEQHSMKPAARGVRDPLKLREAALMEFEVTILCSIAAAQATSRDSRGGASRGPRLPKL
jgi:hypothetical protein